MPRRRPSKKSAPKITVREQARAIFGVAKLSFRSAPGAVIFKACGAVVTAVLPLITTYFAALTTTELAAAYDGKTEAGKLVIVYVLITAVLGLAMTVWQSIDQYIQAKMRYVVEAKVSDRMYEHFLRLDFWRYDDKDTADLYDKATKFAQFFAYVFDRLAGIFSQFITMIAGVAALTIVNIWLGLFVLLALIPGIYLQFRLSREQTAHWNDNVDTRRKKWQIESMFEPRSIAELRLYGVVRHLLDLRMQFRDLDEKTRIEFERKYIPKRLLADGIEAIAEVATLVWAATQIAAKLQPIGHFIYIQQVVSRAMSGASGFVSQLSTIDEDIANLFDYEAFTRLDEYSAGAVQLSQPPEAIVFADVSFHYPGEDRPDVLKHIDMTIRAGQHVAIVGENGAGKSTFVKLLTGIYRPTAGSILLDDRAIEEIDIVTWHQYISALQQGFAHYIFASARDNVVFGNIDRVYDDTHMKTALHAAEADKMTDDLPRGLDTFLSPWMEDDDGNKGIDLSGGQWQRLALARGFYRDAPIIILDEPTSAIDALAESRIFNRLFKRRDRTIITISHRVTTIEKADIIYMFEHGEIVEQGTHVELVAQKGRYYRMFKSQLRETEQ